MSAESDRFIIATFALWAGDVCYVEELFELLPQVAAPSSDEEVIRQAGVRLLKQVRQKRKEFSRLAAEYARGDVELLDTPEILETTHLRAALWRTGERDFLLLGYLKNLLWQKQLLERARDQARISESELRRLSTSGTSTGKADSRAKGDGYGPLGATWVVTGNPFLQVDVTDLGLLRASGIWTEAQLPAKSGEVTEAFRSLLNSLEAARLDASGRVDG